MKRAEDIENVDNRGPADGQVSDEDLEAVTGGLMRPLEPGADDNHRISRRSDADHDDTADG